MRVQSTRRLILAQLPIFTGGQPAAITLHRPGGARDKRKAKNMGGRGNIKMTGGDSFPTPVFLYTHWRGSEMKEIVAAALEKGRARWNDTSYLGRVIFQELIGDDQGVTGFGLSSVIQDNEYPILVVDMDAGAVFEEQEPGERERKLEITKAMPFENFVFKFGDKAVKA